MIIGDKCYTQYIDDWKSQIGMTSQIKTTYFNPNGAEGGFSQHFFQTSEIVKIYILQKCQCFKLELKWLFWFVGVFSYIFDCFRKSVLPCVVLQITNERCFQIVSDSKQYFTDQTRNTYKMNKLVLSSLLTLTAALPQSGKIK